jgi:glycosyltransferase involved in cell wall biosynthesis
MEGAVGELSRRPQLLFLCQTLPFPPDGGVWIRTYHVLRLLSRAFDVTALCFERAGSAPQSDPETSRTALGRLADVEVFAIPQRHSRIRFAWDHARSVARGRVYTAYLYESRAFGERLATRLRSKTFDLVHVDSLDLAAYLPACHGLPIVCVHHDVESALLERRAAIERSPWRKAYLAYQARLMDRVERHWCERVALNVVVSERDAALLKRKAPASRFAVVPNGVDMDEFRPDGTAGAGVAFVGGTNPFPNLDALAFFCDQILPALRRGGEDIPVRWIGRASRQQQRAFRERYGVELTGYADDVRPLMREAACHIVPLRVGGGTRLKILNSWAMGKAVVSTSLGCEGLAAADGMNILIRDDPRDFANAILSVLGDGRLRRQLGDGGCATARRLYSWDVVGQRMIEAYLAVMNAPAAGLARETGPIRVEARYGYS